MQQIITFDDFNRLDDETLRDFYECFEECTDEIEDSLKALEDAGDLNSLDQLYFALQSMKDNFNLCYLDPFVETVHKVEVIVNELRLQDHEYTTAHRDLIGLVIEHVGSLVENLAVNRDVNQSFIKKINQTLDTALNSSEQQRLINIDDAATVLSSIDCETYGSSHANEVDEEEPQTEEEDVITYLKELALRLDRSYYHREGRTEEELAICLAMNERLGNPVDITQLTAAIYAHDLGMTFIPYVILNKPEKLTKEEIKQVRGHVSVGEGLLRHLPNFSEAALIAHQHHESFDGSGYPQGLKGDEIHIGARILAIADTFSATTRNRADRAFKRSLFKAVQEINVHANKQYDPSLLSVFNDVVKELFVKQKLH